jgi:26S proteasome regulatory subunit N5
MSDNEAAKKAKLEEDNDSSNLGGASAGDSQKDPPVTMTPKQRELKAELNQLRKQVDDLKNDGDIDGAMSLITKFEKKTRLVLEYDICAEAAILLIQLTQEKGDLKTLNATILTLTKHRQQHRKVIAAFMKECMVFLEAHKFDDVQEYLEYIETLRTVSEGKIYLEVDAARLTMRIAKHREAEGDTEEASKVLQEVAVETYGTMDKLEKANFLLEQVRLCLVNKDFIRASIVAKKINRSVIRAEDFQTVKLKYYDLMIEFYLHKNDTLQLCECYLEVLHTPSVLANDEKWKTSLAAACLFVSLSAFGREQQQLLHRINTRERERLEKMPAYDALIKQLVTDEIMRWPLAHNDLFQHFLKVITCNIDEAQCEKMWKLFDLRVTEKNIRVAAKCYSRIHTTRLASLVGKDKDSVENILSGMVCVRDAEAEPLYARINRPAGIISFRQTQPAEAVLTAWTSDIGEMMQLVERTKHLIDREIMVHNANGR